MICTNCGKETESFWCDDGIHIAAMTYECKHCGAFFVEEDGQKVTQIRRGKKQ